MVDRIPVSSKSPDGKYRTAYPKMGCLVGSLIVIMIVSCGCITLAKNMMKAPEPVPIATPVSQPIVYQTPQPEPEPVYFKPYIEPPDLTMYRTGGRWLGQNYGWQRENVSGQKDMIVNVTVYDYKFMRGYSWWSVSWGRYFWQMPPVGKKYLFVFVHMVMEGEDQSKDPRMYGMGQDHFYVQYKGNVTVNGTDPDHLIGVRIKELEETFTLNDDVRVFDYGYYRYHIDWGEEQAEELGYLRMGKSNAWDGYIIFVVPWDARADDIRILGRFDGFGNAWWRLEKQPAVVGG